MTIPMIFAEFYGGMLILVGFTMLNKKYIREMFRELAASKALLWITGLVTFLIGLMTLELYDVWSSNWEVIITIIGWLTLLKGIFLTLSPNAAIKFYRKLTGSPALTSAAIIAIILGVILFYLGTMV